MRPGTFRAHLKYLAEQCNVISLEDLTKRLEAREPIPPKTVVITFDGGWVDTYQYALTPLLQVGLPATVFLPTAFIGTDNLFWRDKVVASLSYLHTFDTPFPEFDFLGEHINHALRTMEESPEITVREDRALCDSTRRRTG